MSKSNIMVVEDSGIVLLDIEKSLVSLGYSVVATASSKDEAIRKAEETRPDLVLMDIRLGEEMSGITAADHIREHFNIPIVFLTGYADEDTFQRAKIADPFGYILKPFDPKGLRTTIEIALHNHGLKSKLNESEKRYRTLVETMNDGVGQVDAQGKIVFANDALCRMVGISREELIGREHAQLFAQERQGLHQTELERRKAGKANSFETILTRIDGTLVPVILSGSPVFDQNGVFAGAIGVFTDISERKKSEVALQVSEEKYRTLFSEMSAGCALHEIVCDDSGNAVDCLTIEINSAYEEILGVTREVVVGKRASEFLPEDELKHWLDIFAPVALTGASTNYEMFSSLNNKYFEGSAYSPEPGKFAVTFLGLTERKKAEEEVRKSKHALEEAERLVHLGHYEIDVATGKAVWTEEIFNIFGLDPNGSEPTVDTYNELIHPDDVSKVNELYKESAQQGVPFDLVYRIVRPSGDVRYVHSNARTLLDKNGDTKKLFGTFQDVTNIKQVELALQESEMLYHDLVETAQDMIWQCDRKGRYNYLNPAWEEVFGYHVEEMLGKPFTDFQSPEYAQRDIETFSYLIKGNSVARYETVHLAKDGRELQLVFNAKTVRDSQGNVVGTRGTAYDITERKRAEQALQASESILRESQKIARMGHYRLDFPGGVWESSDGLNELFGIDWDYQTDIEGWFQIVHPDDREVMAAYFIEEVVEKHQDFDREYRIVCVDDGETRWVHGLGRLEFDEDGNPVRMIGNIQDITERKMFELALQEREAKIQSIFRAAPVGIGVVVDRVLQEANTMLCQITGYTRDELIGQSSRMLYPSDREFEYVGTEKYRILKETGLGTVETRWKCKNGDIRDIILSSVPLDRDDLSKGVTFTALDITERKQAEYSLQLKTTELESLFSISSHLRVAQSADEMLPVVLAEMRRVMHSDANAIILLGSDEDYFTYALSDGPLEVNNGTRFNVKNSISGLVLKTRQPYVTENLSSDPEKTSVLQGDDNLGPAVVVPVISESEFLGVLLCARESGDDSQIFSSSDVRLLTAIGEMVGNALRRARLYDQALTRLQHLQILHSIDMAISANLDLSVILDVLLTQSTKQLDVDAASILLLNPHTHMFEFAAGNGFRSKEITTARLRLGEGLPGQAVMDRRIIQIPDVSTAEDLVRRYLLDEGFVSYQAVPLVAKGQLQGVLETFNRRPLEVSEEQTGFLETLATQAAIAIDNSQLFSDLQRSNFELEMAYDATIEGWSRALELRDQETEGHTLRVADMTLRLAQAVGIKGGELTHIRRGALLHDIGKMGIPDRILLKPSKLLEEEWEIMKQHTAYAYEMLWPIDFLRPAINIPHFHHERWDGTGYPRQFKGEQIPLSARVFAVADVWDALTNDRPYRKAWTEEQALDYITTNAGKHFDPLVVEKFLELLDEGFGQ